MRKLSVFSRLAALCLAFALLIPVLSARALTTSARSAFLMDMESGRVLYAQNADQRLAMASTTKIMTALVVVETAELDEIVTVESETVGVIGSSMYLKEGEQLTVGALLYGLMMLSGNDAAATLAVYCGGSQEGFVKLMNKKAADLGLVDTGFANPHGLDDEGHYTTARELAVITAEALRHPVIAEIAGTRETQIAGRFMLNHNKMLRLYEGANGVKTGFTSNARRCLVSSATREGQTLIAVTLDCADDWDEHTAMLDYGFKTYPRRIFVEVGQVMATVPVIGGLWPTVELVAADTLAFPMTDAEFAKTETAIQVPRFVYAGVREGDAVGAVIMLENGAEKASVNICFDKSVEQPEEELNLWQRIGRFFQGIF